MIANNTLVEQYAYNSLIAKEYSVTKSMELQTELGKYRLNNETVDIYLYSSKTNNIISTNIVLSNAEYFFKYSYVINHMSITEMIQRLQNTVSGMEYYPVMTVYASNSPTGSKTAERQVIEYRYRVPIEWRGAHAIQMIISIDAQELFSDLQDIMNEGGEFYVYDKDNRLMYSEGSLYAGLLDESVESAFAQVNRDNEALYGAVYHTEDDNWRIKVFLPVQLERSNALSSVILWIVILPVLISVVLAFWFTLKNYKEIVDILDIFAVHSRDEDKDMQDLEPDLIGYQAIKASAKRIINENNQYRESLTDLKQGRRDWVMDKLIHGSHESREEINKALTEIDFYRWNMKVVVLCIRYEGVDYRKVVSENEFIKELVRKMLPKFTEREVEVFESSARETVCLLFMKEADKIDTVVQELISRLNVEIFYHYGINAKIGVGNMVDSIYEAEASYEQAKQVIKYKETAGNNVYQYSELMKYKDTYYYPEEANDMICSYVLSGKAENAKEILKKLYQENFEKSTIPLSNAAMQMIKECLEACMLSLAAKYEVLPEQLLDDLHREQDMEAYFEVLYGFIDQFTTEIGDKKEKHQNQLVNSIVEYIDQHYGENSLSLKQIAAEFGFQENYMSKLFKSKYGENISEIIEQTRMKRACELLQDTDMMISDVSETVGYGSDISFRRAFKKVMGVTPGEYRKLQESERDTL